MKHSDNFLRYLKYEKRYSAHTLQAYQKDIDQFSTYLFDTYQTERAEDVLPRYIRSWLVQLRLENKNVKSISRKLSALKSFFKFLIKKGLLENNPVENLEGFKKTGSRLPDYLDAGKMDFLLDKIDFGEGFSAQRNHLIINLLYNTGVRRSELINLTINDIDFSRKNILVKGKGNKERLIPLSSEMANLLQEYIQNRKAEFITTETQALLVTDKGKKMYPKFVYRIVKKYLTLVSTVQRRSPHTLRHSFATNLLNEGADLNAIKELLGHSSLASTQIYAHNSIEKLKEIYEKAHPKA